jgi:hypothetical protein
MEWLLGDEDVWSLVLEYRLKRAITFDPTVGSRSNFSTSCFACGSYGMATGRRGCLVACTCLSAQKGHTFCSDRWIALKILQGFPEAVFIGVAMEWLFSDRDVGSVELKY